MTGAWARKRTDVPHSSRSRSPDDSASVTGAILRVAGTAGPRPRPDTPYGEKETVSGISEMPLYFSIASFMRLSL